MCELIKQLQQNGIIIIKVRERERYVVLAAVNPVTVLEHIKSQVYCWQSFTKRRDPAQEDFNRQVSRAVLNQELIITI
jgi:hypothetical protein